MSSQTIANYFNRPTVRKSRYVFIFAAVLTPWLLLSLRLPYSRDDSNGVGWPREVTMQENQSPLPKEWEAALPSVEKWLQELDARITIHRAASTKLRRLNRILGGLNVVLATATATAMYAALSKRLNDLPFLWQVAITLLAILPAASAGLQKEWQVAAREQSHVLLTQQCRLLSKQLAFFIAFPPENARTSLRWSIASLPLWRARVVKKLVVAQILLNKADSSF